MQQVTVSTITNMALHLANQEFSDFIDTSNTPNSELIGYAQMAYEDAYSKIVLANENYFTIPANINIISGQESYPLPTDFYKLNGVDLSINNTAGTFVTLRPFSFSERNKYRAGYIVPIYPYGYLYRYLLVNNNIKFIPVPSQSNLVQIWYTPLMPIIQSLNDTISILPEYTAYMIYKIACLILSKEESDISALNNQRIEALQQLLNSTKEKDSGMAKQVVDIDEINFGAVFPFGGSLY